MVCPIIGLKSYDWTFREVNELNGETGVPPVPAQLFWKNSYDAGRSTSGGAGFSTPATPLCAINSFKSYRYGPYARKRSSSNNRLAPQPRHTWYEWPCIRTGQLILRCQHPRSATTAIPAKPVAITPTGHNQPDFLGFSSFSALSATTTPRELIILSIGRIAERGKLGKVVPEFCFLFTLRGDLP